MFEDSIKIIKNSFLEFKGQGFYILLFVIALIYVFVKEEEKNKKVFFVYTSLTTLILIIFNPIFNKIVGKFLLENVYWRLYWSIPFGIAIAYASVKFIMSNSKKHIKIISTILIVVVIMISGKFIYNSENYTKVGNLYKLPDEHVLIAQLIGLDNEEYKKVIVPDTMVAHIRQIDSSIELAYPRNSSSYGGNPYILAMAQGDTKTITELGKAHNCNYIVMRKDIRLTIDFHYFDYEKFGETASYDIYKLKK